MATLYSPKACDLKCPLLGITLQKATVVDIQPTRLPWKWLWKICNA